MGRALRRALEHVTVCCVDVEAISAVRSVVGEVLDRETDAGTWAAWATAGLAAAPLPEEYGGAGLGLPAVAVLLRESARRGVRVPVWETLCCGGLTLASHGTDAQRKEFLPAIGEGVLRIAPALRDAHGTSAVFDGTTVTGRKVGVTGAPDADRLLILAGDLAVLVDPSDPGVSLIASSASGAEPQHTVVLDGAAAEALTEGSGERLHDHGRDRRGIVQRDDPFKRIRLLRPPLRLAPREGLPR